ncbi:AEC family transporter [Cellulomonas aerilata]|uniref:Membrane protein n=1 Tax=Cellulomonas aerilata TaxID=515326 RepID=A0A512DCM5_9CELL|nr:AEC family transporter [Cellulomonas aerilata]GEO34234.1 membrane protein [Cellulomonas aerilata]
MGGIFTGFAILLALVALGYVAARRGVLPADGQEVLARVVFMFASPALLFVTLLDAPVETVLSALLAGIAASSTVAALVFVLIARWWRRTVGELTIGALASSYVNGANLGIPIAFYVLGDASYVAPVILFQLVVMAPVALAVLDVAERRRDRVRAGTGEGVAVDGDAGPGPGRLARWTRPVRNPIIAGSVLGLAANLTGVQPPAWVIEPVTLLSGAAVPLALLAYGMSLHGMRAGEGALGRDVLVSTGIKVVVHPFIAYGIGLLVGLRGQELFALTVLAALPTAQNVFVYSVRYRESQVLARSTVLLSTLLALPAILVVTALLGA